MKNIVLKKQYIIIYMLVCLLFAIYVMTNTTSKEQDVAVNATPITNKVIILDAGHGMPDERGR